MNDSQDKSQKTQNDIAWEKLFKEHNILENLKKQNYFEIASRTINEVRESRLMAKFDHAVKLPKIFQDNKLSILPISRNKYIIGYFDTYLQVTYEQKLPTTKIEFPDWIESINYTNIHSENLALHCAFNAGIIADLLEVEESQCYFTISGRMSTGEFDFRVKNSRSNHFYDLSVNASQCEIDGGFETENVLLIVEAKNYTVEDFLIRQLYYPYRLWKNKVNKKVIPAFMTYSNDLFSFFIYEFQDPLDYNSIQLVKQVNYQILLEEIDTQEVSELFNRVQVKEECKTKDCPQADIFPRILDLLSLVSENDLTTKDISNYYEFDIRQAQYYRDAAKYLGLITEVQSSQSKIIALTSEGAAILSYGHKEKILSLINKILEHKVFYETFKISLEGGIPTNKQIIEIMSLYLDLSESVIERRSRTVRKWIQWIWSQINY